MCGELYERYGIREPSSERKTVLVGSHGGFILGLLMHLVQDRQMKFECEDKNYRRIARNTAITRVLVKG